MILSFETYCLNESSHKNPKGDIKKRRLKGSLNGVERGEMRRRLRSNIITFRYRKVDGTIRKAIGTLHPDYLPKTRGGSAKPDQQMVYYDLEKHGWRSFRSFTFIKILNMKPVPSTVVSKPKPKPKPEEEEEETKKIHTPEHEEKEEREEKTLHTSKHETHKEHEEPKKHETPKHEHEEQDVEDERDTEKVEHKHDTHDETDKEEKHREGHTSHEDHSRHDEEHDDEKKEED